MDGKERWTENNQPDAAEWEQKEQEEREEKKQAQDNAELFASGSVWKAIATMALPSAIVVVVMIFYNMADMFFIAMAEDTASVAAVSLVGPVFSILAAVATMVGTGGSAMIASAYGAGERERGKIYSSLSIWFIITCAVAVTVVLLAARNPIMTFLGTTKEAWEPAAEYYTALAVGCVFVMLGNAMAMLVKAEGAVKESVVGTMIGTVVNLILDPLLILALHMGTGGAAAATILGNVCTTIYYVIYIWKKASINTLDIRYAMKRPKDILRILAIGLPNGIGSILSGFASTFSNQLLKAYGTGAIAAMAAAGKCTMINDMLIMAVGMGCQPLLAYNYGARNESRLKEIMQKLLLLLVGMGIVIAVLCIVFRGPVTGLFLKEADVLALGERMVIFLMAPGPLVGIGYLVTSYFQAVNRPGEAIIISVLRQGALLIPALYLLEYFLGMDGILLAYALAAALSAAASFWLYRRNRGKTRNNYSK